MSRSRTARFMKVMRRTHLYSALFLLPLVTLYGVTAFLFNHPGAFSDSEVIHLSAEETGIECGDIIDPASVACAVARALHAEIGGEGSPLRVSEARRTHDIVASVRGPSILGRLHLAPQGTGRLSLRPAGKDEGSPFDRSNLDIGGEDLAEITSRLARPLTAHGFGKESVSIQSLPIVFDFQQGDETWAAHYDLARKRLVCHATAQPISVRRALTRLHVQHGFPAGSGARVVWAILVDVMAAAMLVWALTGLLMWWHMRSLRAVGALVLLLGLASIGASAWALITHL